MEDRERYLGVVIGVLLLDDGSHISKLLPICLDHEERLGVLLDLFGRTGDMRESRVKKAEHLIQKPCGV